MPRLVRPVDQVRSGSNRAFPQSTKKTISTMMPTRGMYTSSHHQPLRSMSCSLRTPIASDGSNVTKRQIDVIGPDLLDNMPRSTFAVTMLTRTKNRIQYHNSDRDARPEKPT